MALLAAGTVLASTPGDATAAPRAARAIGGAPVNATGAQVEKALGVGSIPAAVVFIVDVTESMGPRYNNLYGDVYRDVPAYLTSLAQHDPQDQVAIVLLAKRSQTEILYRLGRPQAAVGLPPAPYSDESDFGYAFEKAVDVLSEASPTIKVGQVLLFSDGDVTEPASDDPTYAASNTDFSGPGWNQLAGQVSRLRSQQGMTINAYDVPLGATATSDQYNALRQVFAPDVQTLPQGSSLAATLDSVTPKILDDKIASAAAPDSGSRAGVQVTWSGLPTGVQNFSKPGSIDANVTVTARTTRIPLYLSGLTVTSDGLPVTLTAHLPDQSLQPGHPVALPVHLAWNGGGGNGPLLGSGPQQVQGHLTLTGTVLSPFTRALTTDFNDTGYSPGTLHGAVSAPVTADESPTITYFTLLLFIIALLVALLIAGGGLTWMRGKLVLTSVHRVGGDVQLRGPRRSVSTDGLVGEPGRLTARGTLNRRVRVHVRLDDKPPATDTLRPGERKMIAGIWVERYSPDGNAPAWPKPTRAR